jgi:actin-like ATPase involved in cell morphogenesis
MIGFDAGTYNLVCCKRDENNNFVYKREVNAFIEIPMTNRFVFNMMKNAGVPLIEWKDANVAYALGEAAVNIAYSMNQVDLKRPMHAGCLNPKEKHAQQIMGIMMHSLVDSAKVDKELLYYSVPANAINEETDADYHGHVLRDIFSAFEDEEKRRVNANPINEGLALVYAELAKKAYTGLGISFGAGMVNLCFSIFGAPVFEFAIVNSGDWIDRQAAKATGESIAFINQEKTKVNLTEDSPNLVQRAIKAQYEIMIQKTVTEIKKGLETAGNKARANHPIDVIIAGGTSSPTGFDTLFSETIKKANLPIELGEIIRPADPLYSVARGCLLAAEAAGVE